MCAILHTFKKDDHNNKLQAFISKVHVLVKYPSKMVVGKVFAPQAQVPIYEGRSELDTHVDTFVVDRNCLLMHYTGRVCDVMPYSNDYDPKISVALYKLL